ncbi:MAG: hypothetical protein M1476_07235 [Candidatus Thermoplasmatota archaeon]|nr:hypothetical protein [Candidatus Thermoplasmatota archaeon]
MLIHEINGILNNSCEISFSTESEVSKFSREHDIRLQTNLFLENGDKVRVMHFLPKIEKETKEIQFLLTRFGAKTVEGIKCLPVTYHNSIFARLLFSLHELPSVAMDHVFLDSGRYHVIFRFHDTDQRKVANALLDASLYLNEFRIDELEQGVPPLETFKKLSQFEPLYYAEMSTIPPDAEIIGMKDTYRTNSWIRQIKIETHDVNIMGVYKFTGAVKGTEGLTQISEKDKLYSAQVRNRFLLNLISKSYEIPVTVYKRIQSFDGKEMKFGVMVPEVCLSSFLKMWANTRETMPGWEQSVSYVKKLNYM